MQTVFVFVR